MKQLDVSHRRSKRWESSRYRGGFGLTIACLWMEPYFHHLLGHVQDDLFKELEVSYQLQEGSTRHMLDAYNEKKQMEIEKRRPRGFCEARVWNAGMGGQCSRSKVDGSNYCKVHSRIRYNKLCMACSKYFDRNVEHKYDWQHLGCIHDTPPEFFMCYKVDKVTE